MPDKQVAVFIIPWFVLFVSRCGNGFRANKPHHFVIERFRSAAGSMYFIDCPAEPVTDSFLQRISPFWQIIALFLASFLFHSVPILSGEATTEQA